MKISLRPQSLRPKLLTHSAPQTSKIEPRVAESKDQYQPSTESSSKAGRVLFGAIAGLAAGALASVALPSSVLGGLGLGIAAAIPSAFAGGVAGMALTSKPNQSGMSGVIRAVLSFGAGAATGAIAGGAAGALVGATIPMIGIAAGGGLAGAFLAS